MNRAGCAGAWAWAGGSWIATAEAWAWFSESWLLLGPGSGLVVAGWLLLLEPGPGLVVAGWLLLRREVLRREVRKDFTESRC